LALTEEEERAWREKLEVEKEKALGRKHFSPDVKQELEAIETDLAGCNPDFVAEILRQLAEAMFGYGGGHCVLRVRYARSFSRR
jgi:hypothetical protein